MQSLRVFWAKIYDTYKEILFLLLGSGLSLILPLAFAPVLSRQFSQPDYAMYGLLQAIITPLSAIACGRYELTVVTVKNRLRAVSGVYLSYIISGGLAVVFFALFFLFRNKLNIYFSDNLFIQIWYIIPLFLIVQGIYIVNNLWLQRERAFKHIAINKFLQHSSTVSISLLLGFYGIHSGLIWGLFAGWLVIDISSLIQLKKFKFDFKKFNWLKIKSHAETNIEYPKYNAFPAFLFYLTVNIPMYIMAKKFGSHDLGLFTLTRQMLFIPTSLLSGAISQVIFQRFSNLRNKNLTISKEFKRILIGLLLFSIFLIVVIKIWGIPIFEIFFGKKWGRSGYFAQLLIFSTAMQFICSSFINLLAALGKIKMASFWQYLYFFVIISLYFVETTIENFLRIYAYLDIASYLLYFTLILIAIVKYERNLKTK